MDMDSDNLDASHTDYLLRNCAIHPDTLEQADAARHPGESVAEALIRLGVLKRAQVLACAAAELAADKVDYEAHPEAEPAVEFDHVVKTLDGRRVLDGIDLSIPRGRITALVGVSGGGKSVTLKHMIGLMRPDSGKIRVFGQCINRLPSRELNTLRRRFGVLFQGGALFDSMNVFDNVAFPLRETTTMSEADIAQHVQRRLKEVNLQGMEAKFPDELSGGMLKRAALARALVNEPEILLLDEPTAGLDPIIENAIHHLIAETWLRARYTMVFISHAVPEILNWCHHVVVFHEGKVRASCPAGQLRRSEDPVIRQFTSGTLQGPIRVI
ncbi:MAG: ATP-binding cassette domain-containing protein [Magnetococcus sp. WYHC-3]